MSLSTNELAQLRTDHETYMPDTCTIQTETRTADGMGGDTIGWSNQYTSVPCRLAPLAPSPDEDAQQFTVHTGWVLTVHHDQAISSGNRVVMSSDTYEVLSVEDDHSWRSARRATIRRMD